MCYYMKWEIHILQLCFKHLQVLWLNMMIDQSTIQYLEVHFIKGFLTFSSTT